MEASASSALQDFLSRIGTSVVEPEPLAQEPPSTTAPPAKRARETSWFDSTNVYVTRTLDLATEFAGLVGQSDLKGMLNRHVEQTISVNSVFEALPLVLSPVVFAAVRFALSTAESMLKTKLSPNILDVFFLEKQAEMRRVMLELAAEEFFRKESWGSLASRASWHKAQKQHAVNVMDKARELAVQLKQHKSLLEHGKRPQVTSY